MMPSIQQPSTQRGAVLIMALVLMTVMTLAGVASMSGSTLELRSASNAQQYYSAFEAAQSRIEFAASNNPNNPLDYLAVIPDVEDPATWPVQTCDASDGCPDANDGSWTATATMEFTGGCAPMAGYSQEAGRSVVMRTFAITVEAQNAAGTSRSIQVQGVRHPAASC